MDASYSTVKTQAYPKLFEEDNRDKFTLEGRLRSLFEGNFSGTFPELLFTTTQVWWLVLEFQY